MSNRPLGVVLALAVLGQTGCAIGFRGEAGRPLCSPALVVPPDSMNSGPLQPTTTPEVPPRIQPVPSREGFIRGLSADRRRWRPKVRNTEQAKGDFDELRPRLEAPPGGCLHFRGTRRRTLT